MQASEIARQVIVFPTGPRFLKVLMPALDLALGLRMIGARHEPIASYPARRAILPVPAGDVAGPVVAEQAAFMDNPRLI